MRLSGALLVLLGLPVSAQAECRPYEAFAFEGRVLSARALEAGDLPDSPNVDGEGARRALADEPMVLVEVALEARRRVAVCTELTDCKPAARTWADAGGEARFLGYGLPADWQASLRRVTSFYAPTDCCRVRPSAIPGCAMRLPVIVATPEALRELVHGRAGRALTTPAGGEAQRPEPEQRAGSDSPAGVVAVEQPNPREAVSERHDLEPRLKSPRGARERAVEAAAGDGDVSVEGSARLERARELYALGPDHADEVIALLRLELSERPDHDEARRMLAITLFGSRRFEDAIRVFDEVFAADAERGELSPRLQLLKARALEAIGRDEESRELLHGKAALFMENGRFIPEAAELSDRLALRELAAETSDHLFLRASLQAISEPGRESWDGALALVVRSPDFERLAVDGDLAPAIASALRYGDDVIVLVVRGPERALVFFRDGRPSGTVPDGEARRDPPVSSSAGAELGLSFQLRTMTADDGSPLVAYSIHEAPPAAPPASR